MGGPNFNELKSSREDKASPIGTGWVVLGYSCSLQTISEEVDDVPPDQEASNDELRKARQGVDEGRIPSSFATPTTGTRPKGRVHSLLPDNLHPTAISQLNSLPPELFSYVLTSKPVSYRVPPVRPSPSNDTTVDNAALLPSSTFEGGTSNSMTSIFTCSTCHSSIISQEYAYDYEYVDTARDASPGRIVMSVPGHRTSGPGKSAMKGRSHDENRPDGRELMGKEEGTKKSVRIVLCVMFLGCDLERPEDLTRSYTLVEGIHGPFQQKRKNCFGRDMAKFRSEPALGGPYVPPAGDAHVEKSKDCRQPDPVPKPDRYPDSQLWPRTRRSNVLQKQKPKAIRTTSISFLSSVSATVSRFVRKSEVASGRSM